MQKSIILNYVPLSLHGISTSVFFSMLWPIKSRHLILDLYHRVEFINDSLANGVAMIFFLGGAPFPWSVAEIFRDPEKLTRYGGGGSSTIFPSPDSVGGVVAELFPLTAQTDLWALQQREKVQQI